MRGGGMGAGFWCGGRKWLVGFAAIDLLVGAAKRAEPLEGLDHPEGNAGLLAARALAHDAIRIALGQRSRSVGYGLVAQASRVSSSGSSGSSAGQCGGVLLDLADGFGHLVHVVARPEPGGPGKPRGFSGELVNGRAGGAFSPPGQRLGGARKLPPVDVVLHV